MNIDFKGPNAAKVVAAISALKEKSEEVTPSTDGKQDVDLVAIVKKLSRNREKAKKGSK